MTATHARVTNGNDFPIEDRYDGIPVTFEPGVPKVVGLEAAALFFGFPVDDEGNVTFAVDWGYFARRHGWTNMVPRKDEPLNDMFQRITASSAEKCSKVKVEPVAYTLREVVQGEEELPPPRAENPTPESATADSPEQQDERHPARRKITVG